LYLLKATRDGHFLIRDLFYFSTHLTEIRSGGAMFSIGMPRFAPPRTTLFHPIQQTTYLGNTSLLASYLFMK